MAIFRTFFGISGISGDAKSFREISVRKSDFWKISCEIFFAEIGCIFAIYRKPEKKLRKKDGFRGISLGFS
jgi:hypothetical protein